MNKNISLNNRLKYNVLIKADFIRNNEANKIRTKNEKTNDSEGNFKSSKKNKNKNFLRKQNIKENNNSENMCLPDYFFKNNIIQYYYSTIEYMKKYYNSYMNRYFNNSISKNNNTLNKTNYNIFDNNINNKSFSKTSNINENNNMKNTFFINNYEDKNINFIFNNSKNMNMKNKTIESFNNLSNKDTKKINEFSKEVINNNNLNSNNNEFKNLIMDINCPSFKPSNFKNNENNANNFIKSESIFSNKDENTNKGKENGIEKEEEYSLNMFGKKGWICAFCSNFNFETRVICNRCKALKNPKKIVNAKFKIKNENNINNDDQNNDWICSKCQNLNYSFRTICNRCKAPKIYQYQFAIKPFLYQNIIYNNIIRYSPKLTPSYTIFNNTPNIYLNKIV